MNVIARTEFELASQHVNHNITVPFLFTKKKNPKNSSNLAYFNVKFNQNFSKRIEKYFFHRVSKRDILLRNYVQDVDYKRVSAIFLNTKLEYNPIRIHFKDKI